MVNFTHLKKHRQFGLKLLIAAVLVGLIFSVWYFTTRIDTGTVKKDMVAVGTDKISIPGDDLRDMKDIYLRQAHKLISGDYSDVQLAANFQFMNFTDSDALKGLGKEKFWSKFNETFLPIDPKLASYVGFGNQVAIRFQVIQKNPATSTNSTNFFIRKLSFGDYDKENRSQISNPLLLEDAIISDDSKGGGSSLKMGDELPSELKAKAIVDGQIVLTDIAAKKGHWKLFFFFPNAFSYICPTECVALMENYKKLHDMNVDIYGISGDLTATLQAWSSKYFGNLPYPLVSDPDLKLSEEFGFKYYQEGVTYRGTVIVDPTNKIRYIAAQDNSVGRDIEEYIRMFAALQLPGLKPANWKIGDPVIMP